MTLIAGYDSFGAARGMRRVTIDRYPKIWGRKIYRKRLRSPWRRAKWLWIPRHLDQRAGHRVRTSNRHWLRQHDRMLAIIRPAHLRKPKRMAA